MAKTKLRKAKSVVKASARKGATAKASKPTRKAKKVPEGLVGVSVNPTKKKKAAKKKIGRPRKSSEATA